MLRNRLYCRHPGSFRRKRSSLFDLNSRYRFGRSFGLAGLSAAARGFGSNGDRVDGAGTGRENQTNRCGTNYIGSDSEGIGTTGREARARQNCCQSPKLIRGQRRTQGPRPQATTAVVNIQLADETTCRLNEAQAPDIDILYHSGLHRRNSAFLGPSANGKVPWATLRPSRRLWPKWMDTYASAAIKLPAAMVWPNKGTLPRLGRSWPLP
jgi:hypothetical protein